MQRINPDQVNRLFGERLALLRKTRNRSQVELADAMGLSRGSISNLESGIQNVQLHQVFSLALALDAPLDELIPLMQDVVTLDDDGSSSGLRFLENSIRQLMELESVEGDDENS